MQKFVTNQVINGTWGEVWLDDEYIGEVVSCKGEVSVSYTDVSMVRSLTAGKKMTKLEGKGSIKLHHVRSNISKRISDKELKLNLDYKISIRGLMDANNRLEMKVVPEV